MTALCKGIIIKTNMGEKISLFHGTIHEFDSIDVSKGKPFKDFGAGFYLSPLKKHSESLALRNRQIELMRINQQKKKARVRAFIYTYEFDFDHIQNLALKNFPQADAEWMKFVVSNRNSSKREHNFDIVMGPTANDNTRASIQAFFAGAYGDVKTDRAVNMLINLLEPQKLPVQFFFGSQRAANLLVFKNRAAIE